MLPFLPGEDAWDDIKGDQPFRIAAFAINGKGHADAAKQKLGFLALAFQLRDGRRCQPARNFAIGRARRLGFTHFVKGLDGFRHRWTDLLFLRRSGQRGTEASGACPKNGPGGALLPARHPPRPILGQAPLHKAGQRLCQSVTR